MANIRLVRIDFRLIHGQVVNKWIKITQSNKIVVIDDTLAVNDFMKSVYVMAAPPGVEVQIYTVEDALTQWKENQFGAGNALILFKGVREAYNCYKGGFHYDHLQIGGLGALPGRKIVFGPITLDKSDADLLTDLNNNSGVRVYFHQVPDDPSAEFEKVMSKVKFEKGVDVE